MRRIVVMSCLVFAAIAACPLDTDVLCPGCVDRSRDNSGCAWVGDTPFVLTPQNPAHRSHLVADAQLAEGLAVRFADAEHKRLFGIEHHGGLIANGGVWRGCMSRMTSTIVSHHSVTSAQVTMARAARPRGFDAAVGLLFVPLYLLASTVVWRALAHRFTGDAIHVRTLAAALATFTVTLLGCYLFVLWSMPWEAIRVGNGHIGGFRLATANRHGVVPLVMIGAPLFWVSALLCRRVAWSVTVGAASVSCAVLTAMFARTFATGAMGYVLPGVALVMAVLAAGALERIGADDAPIGHHRGLPHPEETTDDTNA